MLLKALADPSLNAKLSDICIGTSAAPTYFPPYEFPKEDKYGEIRKFNLRDGGVTANNPVTILIPFPRHSLC